MTKSNENDKFARGLEAAKDPYDIKDLLVQKIEDLAAHIHVRIRYTALDMVDQGRYFHAMKQLCKHGEWEPFVTERKWSWDYVRCCMKLTEVTAWLPNLMHAPAGGVAQRLMHFPKPVIKEMLTDLSAEEISKLTPWDLQRLHNKIPKRNSARKKKEYSLEIPDFDQDLSTLVRTANKALLEISEHSIDPKHKDQALKDVRMLVYAWDRAAYNLSDPEHKRTPRWKMTIAERALDGISDDDEVAL